MPIGVRIIGIIIAVLAAAYGLYAGMGNSTGNFDGEMQIFALDVGQGDSFFIISPNGKTMLIDSGESSNSKQIEQFIREKGVRQLDVVIGSHTHSDHVGSMPYLLDAFDVGKYVMSEAGLETRIQKRINAVLEEKDIPCSYVWAGDVIDWDSDCKVTVLSPVPEFDEYSKTDWNEWSLIMRVEYAIISVGKGNSYGHPDYDTIQKLKQVNAEIYRTDELGTINIVFSANDIKITY